ncbi:MAG: isoprenylcysteine carboxylmethyltransferase family protein [Alphaproteobacteria bacterium]
MGAHGLIVGFIVAQRLAELLYGKRNLTRLVARGGIVADEPGYRWIVLVHAGWLLALAFLVPADAPVYMAFLALYGALLLFRVWVMASLGPYWTTRIVTMPGAPLRANGPYRWLNHPNYLLIAGELAVAPLIFGAWQIAAVALVAHAIVTRQRIALEDKVLAERRRSGGAVSGL